MLDERLRGSTKFNPGVQVFKISSNHFRRLRFLRFGSRTHRESLEESKTGWLQYCQWQSNQHALGKRRGELNFHDNFKYQKQGA